MRRRSAIRFGDILEEFFKRPYIAWRLAESRLPETWQSVVGEQVAAMTRELRFENGILHVKVESSLMRHELFHQREALRQEINRQSGVRFVNSVIVR